MSFHSFIAAAMADGVCMLDSYAGEQAYHVDVLRRGEVLPLAAAHELPVSVVDRYSARIDGGNHWQLLSPVPDIHLAIGLAHVLLDWDDRLSRGGDLPELPHALWATASSTAELTAEHGVLDTPERKDVARVLGRAGYTRAAAGEYGTDPAPVDARHETLAALVLDRLGRAAWWKPSAPLAGELALETAVLTRGVQILSTPDHAATAPARPGHAGRQSQVARRQDTRAAGNGAGR